MTAELSAITLTQPWAQLSLAPLLPNVAPRSPNEHDQFVDCQPGQPLKIHETRGYRLSGTPRRIVIHSGRADGGMRDAICDNYGLFNQPYAMALAAIGYSTLDPWWLKYEERRRLTQPHLKPMQLGYVLGLVTVTKMIATAVGEPAHTMDRALGNWAPGRWSWKMEDPFLLERPFHARGFQSVWKVAEYQQAMIREQGGTW